MLFMVLNPSGSCLSLFYEGGPQKSRNLFIKNLCHLQSSLHLIQYTYWDFFPTAQNSFWMCPFWCVLSDSAISLFCLFHMGKTFPFEGFLFIWGKKKKLLEWDQMNREGGALGVMPFLAKNCWTLSAEQASVLVNHPSWNRQTRWESLQKTKFAEAECSLSHNASWCSGTGGFLEHPPNGKAVLQGPALLKIIQCSLWGRVPLLLLDLIKAE